MNQHEREALCKSVEQPIGNNGTMPEVRPHHYVSRGMEAWDVIEAFNLNFNTGNSFKYISRYLVKPTSSEMIKDLRKAVTYLNREIKLIQMRSPESASGNIIR